MAALYDHFHATFKHEGENGEIEGGWTGYPDHWKTLTEEDRKRWWREKCVNWGMPRGAEILNIWLAG